MDFISALWLSFIPNIFAFPLTNIRFTYPWINEKMYPNKEVDPFDNLSLPNYSIIADYQGTLWVTRPLLTTTLHHDIYEPSVVTEEPNEEGKESVSLREGDPDECEEQSESGNPVPNVKRENEYTMPLETDDGVTLYEGDMILTQDQVDQGYKKRARKAESRQEYRWPNATIPFSITASTQKVREVIMNAIKHWMAKTCLKFVEVAENSPFPHLLFKKMRGCSSAVGRQAKEFPNGQPISIGEGCEEMGLIAHEIGHAIGFYHEHSRSDRDNVIKVIDENIKPVHARNFYIAKFINPMSIPYDVNSIMHYNSRSFTLNGKNTLITVDPWKQLDIGQRDRLSYLDIKLANIMYCTDKQPNCPIKCKNDGILGTNCKCVCPSGYEGSQCEKRKLRPCGGFVKMPGIITTPMYPQNYPEDSKCIWWILAPKNKHVKLTFEDFDLMPRDNPNDLCEWDILEIRAQDKYRGEVYCGEDQKSHTIISAHNQIILLFSTIFGDNRGFKAKIEFINNVRLNPRSGRELFFVPPNENEFYDIDEDMFQIPLPQMRNI